MNNGSLGVEDFVEWDVRNWSVALDFWVRNSGLDLTTCSALEIGSRHGGLSLWLATQGARVVCTDVNGPSDVARERHRESGLSHRIGYRPVDATDIPFADAFDLVLFKSVLGAVGARRGREAQARAIAEMHKALKSGGELFFAENLVGSPLHSYLRRRFVRWGRTWRYVSVPEMLGFLKDFSSVRYRTVGFAGALGRGRRQRNALGSLDRMLLDRLVPERWRYIMVGVARK
jgi:SAM-dependent methyltransferase